MARSFDSNSPPHSMVMPWRARHVLLDRAPARRRTKRAQVAAAHVHADADVALAVLAVDRGAPVADADVGQRRQRHQRARAAWARAAREICLDRVARALGRRSTTSNERSPSHSSPTTWPPSARREEALQLVHASRPKRPSDSRRRLDLQLRHLAALDDAEVGDARHARRAPACRLGGRLQQCCRSSA